MFILLFRIILLSFLPRIFAVESKAGASEDKVGMAIARLTSNSNFVNIFNDNYASYDDLIGLVTMTGKKGYHSLMLQKYADVLQRSDIGAEFFGPTRSNCTQVVAKLADELSLKTCQVANYEILHEISWYLHLSYAKEALGDVYRQSANMYTRTELLLVAHKIANETLHQLIARYNDYLSSAIYLVQAAAVPDLQFELDKMVPQSLIRDLSEIVEYTKYPTPAAMSQALDKLQQRYGLLRYVNNPKLGLHYLRRGYVGYGSLMRRFRNFANDIQTVFSIAYELFRLLKYSKPNAPYVPTPEMFYATPSRQSFREVSLLDHYLSTTLSHVWIIASLSKSTTLMESFFISECETRGLPVRLSFDQEYVDGLCESLNATKDDSLYSVDIVSADEQSPDISSVEPQGYARALAVRLGYYASRQAVYDASANLMPKYLTASLYNPSFFQAFDNTRFIQYIAAITKHVLQFEVDLYGDSVLTSYFFLENPVEFVREIDTGEFDFGFDSSQFPQVDDLEASAVTFARDSVLESMIRSGRNLAESVFLQARPQKFRIRSAETSSPDTDDNVDTTFWI